jgi:phosphoribosylformimino-5-aminoimidazole carboxamide ribotide isomerase
MEKETVYSEIPEEMALRWFEQGAERLHLVDLDGAVRGKPINRKTIRNITHKVPIPIQLGGGIRNMATVEAYLDLGVSQVILGTVAHKEPDFVLDACSRFPGKVILAIDAKKDKVSVEGWTEETVISPIEMALRFDNRGISSIIYTDIHRDGMSAGPNVEATEVLAKAVQTPVIASGGIYDIHDVAKILPLSRSGVIGVITGRALYQGTLDLAEAIRLSRN